MNRPIESKDNFDEQTSLAGMYYVNVVIQFRKQNNLATIFREKSEKAI